MGKNIKLAMTPAQAVADMKEWLLKRGGKGIDERDIIFTEKLIDMFFVKSPAFVDKSQDTDYENKLLWGFSFFLSAHEDFVYTRSFLMERSIEYMRLCKEIPQKLESVVIHFNQIIAELDLQLRPYRIQYNGLYSFQYDTTEKRWKASIKSRCLRNLLKSGNVVFQIVGKDRFMTDDNVIYTDDLSNEAGKHASELKIIIGL